jgi:triosephosphate isomerase (TIM)
MRRPLVAGNWKMHGSTVENAALVEQLINGIEDGRGGAEVLVCPPFVYLPEVVRRLKGTPVRVGAQNASAEPAGAFTGEISVAMLKDVGCEYVIVGHSERRAHYREDDAVVARKFRAVLGQGLVPILCVGETLDERESGATESVVGRQLDAVLSLAGVASFARAVVAYEPVWAIGTGKNASPDQAQAVHRFIRDRVASGDANIADGLRILYGGSVKAGNAAELFAQPDVDGGLVGGASLKGDEFLEICAAAG